MAQENDLANGEKSAGPSTFSLDNILDGDDENVDLPPLKDAPEGSADEETAEGAAAHGFCIECEGMLDSGPSTL